VDTSTPKPTSPRSLAVRVLVGVVMAAALAASTGCATVAPYERGKLAHPMMTADDLEGPAAAHVLAVHEGATGGGPLSESGCGCN
jgi:H+/gluconate symporter-like permease